MSLNPSNKKKWRFLAVPLLALAALWCKPAVSVSNAGTAVAANPAIVPFHLCSFPSSGSVNVTLIGQQSTNWCWAACTEMVMSFMGHDVPQCTLAQQVTGKSNCCKDYTCTGSSTSPCDTAGNPAEAFNNNNFVYDLTPEGIWPKPVPLLPVMPGQPLPWADVCRQIYCYGRPVIIGYAWVAEDGTNTGGHWVVAKGYTTTSDGGQWLDINDPDNPQCTGNSYFYNYDYVVGNTATAPYFYDHVMSKFVYNIAPKS